MHASSDPSFLRSLFADVVPFSIPWAAANVPAILEVWYPGALGGSAVADVLFGTLSLAHDVGQSHSFLFFF